MKAFLVTLIFCLSTPLLTFAVEAGDVARYWVNSKFPNCGELADLVALRANQSDLRKLAREECSGLPRNPGDCAKAADRVLAERFDMQAKRYECPVSTSFYAQEDSTPKKETFRISTVCANNSFVGPTTVSAAGETYQVCRKRAKCSYEFSYYGKTFEKGEYEFTCRVAPGTLCSNIDNIQHENCARPTIQEIGWIYNGSVERLNEAAGVD